MSHNKIIPFALNFSQRSLTNRFQKCQKRHLRENVKFRNGVNDIKEKGFFRVRHDKTAVEVIFAKFLFRKGFPRGRSAFFPDKAQLRFLFTQFGSQGLFGVIFYQYF